MILVCCSHLEIQLCFLKMFALHSVNWLNLVVLGDFFVDFFWSKKDRFLLFSISYCFQIWTVLFFPLSFLDILHWLELLALCWIRVDIPIFSLSLLSMLYVFCRCSTKVKFCSIPIFYWAFISWTNWLVECFFYCWTSLATLE